MLTRKLLANLTLSAFATALLVGISSAIALADTVDVRNPFDTGAQITQDWNHPDYAPTPYAERSLDMVYSGSRSTVNASVISRIDNGYTSNQLYYDVFDYGTSCNGVKHVLYKIDGGTPVYQGTIVYLHIYGYTTGNYYYINASSSEYRTLAWVASSTCGKGTHLHHGRVTDSGPLYHATWLTAAVASGDGADVTSSDITLYKNP